MDAYHKVLVELYKATGGRDTQAVDFKELVKNQGFLGNYDDIFQVLSSQGWIAETTKSDFVKITHWGAKEARKSSDGATGDNSQELKKAANRSISDAKELLTTLEEFAAETSQENFGRVEKKFGELNSAILKLKSGV